ncbi:MAG TPA: hypothetical protein VJQ25_12590 [Nitrospira sp.]|nr:hypothetical protein [Nitrospira sp.]
MEKHMHKSPVRNWSEGVGDRAHQHFEIWYGEEERKTTLLARVWPTETGPHTVELYRESSLIEPVRVRVLEGLMHELDLSLMKAERDVSKYILANSSTASHVYSPYGWVHINPVR